MKKEFLRTKILKALRDSKIDNDRCGGDIKADSVAEGRYWSGDNGYNWLAFLSMHLSLHFNPKGLILIEKFKDF